MLRLPSLVLALGLISACGGGSSEPDENADTVGFSGTVSGLQGEITIAINGAEETLSNNGAFTASTRISIDDSYSVQVVDSTLDLECTVSNASGVAASNVTNIVIECNGEDFTAYHLSELAFNVEEPSVITFAFHLIDRFTGTAVDTITSDNVEQYLNVLENGSAISATQSFLEIDQLTDVNSDYHNVFAIENSTAITAEQIDAIVEAIRGLIVDGNGESKLLPGQSISLLTFDSEVEVLIEKSQDINEIIAALDMVSVSGNSTNLYGAISSGVEMWSDEISMESVSYGSLMVFTGNADSSEKVSKESALAASDDKDVYFIVVGDDADTEVLAEFTASENIFEFANIDDLQQTIDDALAQVSTFQQGLYVLSYATPKRAGDHQLTISGVDDFRCDTALTDTETAELEQNGELSNCVDEVNYEFSADNFEDVTVALEVTGSTLTLQPEVEWRAKLRWSRATPEFDWNVTPCWGSINSVVDGDSAVFTRTSSALSVSQVEIYDVTTGQSYENYLIMAPTSLSLQSLTEQYLNQLCGN